MTSRVSSPTPITRRSACAKIILCGEHAVVYGRPAIALPLPQLRAYASVQTAGERIEVIAPDIQAHFFVDDQPDHPLAQIIRLTLNHVLSRITLPAGAFFPPPFTLQVRSDIPVSSHLGSGAAVSVACARAIATHLGCELSADEASALTYEVEKLHHGTPSGIDNTVIAHEQPVWFVRGQSVEVLTADKRPSTRDDLTSPVSSHPVSSVLNHVVIADTGISTPTRIPVGQVRAGWERNRADYEARFDAIAALVQAARAALAADNAAALGAAMGANHTILQGLGVSSPELDTLCAAAHAAGAWGAKLSGGGQGGNIIALARDALHAEVLRAALRAAGAVRVF